MVIVCGTLIVIILPKVKFADVHSKWLKFEKLFFNLSMPLLNNGGITVIKKQFNV